MKIASVAKRICTSVAISIALTVTGWLLPSNVLRVGVGSKMFSNKEEDYYYYYYYYYI